MLMGYNTFFNSLIKKTNLKLTYLITNLIQEKTLMKSVNITIDNPSILYVGKNKNKSRNIFENGNILNGNSFNKI